jgi:ERCC4-type nuclease
MKLIVDTREKKNTHILKYFILHDVDYIERKLDVADYQIEGKPDIAIDRKQNLEELARNLMNRADHSRFWKEVRRAKESGIKMIILCEHGKGINAIPDVAKWQSKYTTVTGRALMDEIYRVHIAYGVEFLFCSKRSTGKRILELLGWQNEI